MCIESISQSNDDMSNGKYDTSWVARVFVRLSSVSTDEDDEK
jgi:hypothetical protein